MPVTIVGRRRAQAGQEEALIAAAIPLLERRRASAVAPSRVFQSLSDPRAVLYVDQWESRAAFEAQDPRRQAPLDAMTEGRAVWRYYEPLIYCECMLRSVPAVGCASLRTPVGSEAAVQAYLIEQAGPLIQAQPGCLLRVLYQDLDDPGLLFGLTGWESLAALADAQLRVLPQTDTWLREQGVHYEHFQARTRAEVALEPARE